MYGHGFYQNTKWAGKTVKLKNTSYIHITLSVA